ncbi:TerB N-terminal domain-containing protein, partial [bacterium]|nr:TerB N-terminal domain-containing protein [bacterium]
DYKETILPFANSGTADEESSTLQEKVDVLREKIKNSIPQKIRDMKELYEHKNGFRKNFYIQGKFMENYEDDMPWNGDFLRYFPTYNDLNIEQLRGYFTWRTHLRKGEYLPIATSLAYIYVYELLNGIGTVSVEDSLQKLKEFEEGFIDSGIGDVDMKTNIRRWMFEFAVVNGFPLDVVRQYADPDMLAFDKLIITLKKPNEHSDDEIFEALIRFGGKKITISPVIKNNESEGKRLFARIWRYTLENFSNNAGRKLFSLCFGGFRYLYWYPLDNAIYYKENKPDSLTCELNECHKFVCKKGVWKTQCYYEEGFNKRRFKGLLHEADRLLRMYLKIGNPIKEMPDEAWATPYIQAVIEADKKEKLEASKPKINICLDNLEQIRQDALSTCDSLLTEEEKLEEFKTEKIEEVEILEPVVVDVSNESMSLPLDKEQIQVLTMLLNGDSVKETLKSLNKMPQVFADSLNDVLFEEIGDIVVECNDNDIVLIEDYREDIERIIGGK